MGAVGSFVRPVEEDDKVQASVIQPFRNIRGIADVKAEADVGVLLMKR